MKENPPLVTVEATPRWRRFSLAQRFALAGSLVLLAGALAIGSWVSQRIEDGVVSNTAISTALYMESFIAPLTQDLRRADTLGPGARQALKEIFQDTPLGERVVSFKIWKKGGLVVHASDPSLIGQRFEPSDRHMAAWRGEVSAVFEDLSGAENKHERAIGMPLLEIYSPVREVWSGEVIAVAEFYETAVELRASLLEARMKTWLMVAAVTLSMGALLFGIVLGGSRTIARQQRALEARIGQLAALADQNATLRRRVQDATSRAAARNERYLRRIGADLHDGPAQLLGFAALRLDAVTGIGDRGSRDKEVEIVRQALDDAMRDIRDISRGLTLPEVENLPLGDVVRRAVAAHQQLSGAEVTLRIRGDGSDAVAQSLKICVYRFVQEGLSNALRHAGGKGLVVSMVVREGTVRVRVSDSGPGFDAADTGAQASASSGAGGLGLPGLRDRVESLGGLFEISSAPGKGAHLSMTLDLDGGSRHD